MIILAIILAVIVSKIFGSPNYSEFMIKHLSIIILGVLLNVILLISTGYYIKGISEITVNYYYIFHVIYLLLFALGLILNKNNFGLVITGIGFLLNALPIVLNKKMPVAIEYISFINENKANIILNGRSLSHGVFNNPKLYILSDIIYLKFPFNTIISIGDILISVGLFLSIIIHNKVICKKAGE